MKKILILILCMCVLHTTAFAAEHKVDYMSLMIDAVINADDAAGLKAERARNAKIDALGLSYEKVSYKDLYWLSRVINAEVGSDWHTDELQRMVGSVVLNRVNSNKYANTIYNVIYEKFGNGWQYGCAMTGSVKDTPTEKAVKNALYLLENGSILPDGVLTQSEWIWGEVHAKYTDEILGTTMYFCYLE